MLVALLLLPFSQQPHWYCRWHHLSCPGEQDEEREDPCTATELYFHVSPCGCGSSHAQARAARRFKPGSKRRVMGDVISSIKNFLGFGQVSVYTIHINTIASCVLISLCSLARAQ